MKQSLIDFVEAVFSAPLMLSPTQDAIGVVCSDDAGWSVPDHPRWRIYRTDAACQKFIGPDGEVLTRAQMIGRLREARSMFNYHLGGGIDEGWKDTVAEITDWHFEQQQQRRKENKQ